MVAGRYRLRSVLGSGSMGTVWSAYDEFLHRQVAVKEMKVPPGIPASQADELRERTLREARAIAVLSHPNVIILHDVAREDDQPFVVMELLPSRSLAHILRDHGPLTVGQAAAVGIAVASALEAAHAAGITHRDVKPGNVLVASDGRIKLTDFGIARNVSEATMTRTGIMLGSPAYIAPEVASGGAVTPAADLWGLGATLFAAVEGAPPYDADGDPLETVGKVVNGKVPQPKAGPLADVIGALMKKEPGQRITLREVRHRLYPLQTKTPLDLFGPELFHTPDGKKTSAQPDATDTQVIKTVLPEKAKAEKKAEGSSSELATDPGPLPFLRPPSPAPSPTPSAPTVFVAPPRPARRSSTATAVLVAVAILLFLLAAGGGFALARAVGGQSLLPPAAAPRSTSNGPTDVPPPSLVQQSGDASYVTGNGGQFGLQVPEGWQKFVAPHTTRFGASTAVQYVSPDGRRSLRVERLVKYFAQFPDDNEYIAYLKTSYPGNAFFLFPPSPLPDGKGTTLTYRLAEGGTLPESDGGGGTRVTFMNLVQAGTSLWILSVTVPAEQENSGRQDVFDRVAPTLSVSD
ncbi:MULTISPECIES: serine/threonine-protein kinase [unclassified Amycolatopsis]|uniref:serine/threonine-protein kinase n=2 Tax=Amycolatopsis TaxID=1813 RepID=UPI002876F02D|nr:MULTISPECIES: serine/threonine-protein kinase [unclassified Amycolatopsis]MDS0135222.1 serine/threonine protein kinase [Amycolatopsis sp. 505]MDS0143001.1 serine/threonine protein kinase [Amycolatopsis sp. CM201R]